ncbi:MAG: precorrin-2 dehydrogenase/sirohydrochlorin ferrochelatase family protein [Actinomycetota bacterium]
MTTGYPAILMLDGRLGVVIGGGAVGERKVRTLLDAGARVRVITPEATPRLQTLAQDQAIELHERAYERGDLKGAAVVIASTDERAVNQAIYEEALDEGIPVNVVDDTPHCTFIAPSIVRRGDLMIAISTGGTNPAMAVRIRQRLEEEFGPEYEAYFDLIKRLKTEVSQAPTQEERADAWYRVADSDVLDLVRAGKLDEAYARAVELLGSA